MVCAQKGTRMEEDGWFRFPSHSHDILNELRYRIGHIFFPVMEMPQIQPA